MCLGRSKRFCAVLTTQKSWKITIFIIIILIMSSSFTNSRYNVCYVLAQQNDPYLRA